MSDYENPYQSPETPIIPEKVSNSGVSLSETMLRYLKEASPWLRFIGIVGIVGSGFMVLGGIVGAIGLFVASSYIDDMPFPTWLVSLIYLPAGALLFFPSLFTYRFGIKIRNYLINNLEEDLELAFKNNKSLWKFNGIVYIIYLAALPVFFIVAIIVGIAAAIPGF